MDFSKTSALIVDDNSSMRKILAGILKGKGFSHVDEAGTGDQALELCRTKFYNLVLLDVRLKDTSGLEILESLRRLCEDTVVIMMTGYASLETSMDAMNKGAYSYLVKPIDMKQAMDLIGKAIEKQRLAMENRRLLRELQEAMSNIKRLKALLPICTFCKKIRGEDGGWEQVETYLALNTDTKFSHGICPDCLKRKFPEYSD